jgi:hypothetical protein
LHPHRLHRTVPNDDYPKMLDIELIVVVDHPEYPSYTPSRGAQFVRLVLQPAYGGWYADHWQLRESDWWYKCGLDEAPLAWALNTHSLAPLAWLMTHLCRCCLSIFSSI